ncbi:MAG: hypothetical protein CL579_16570 [Alteromonadaceae bacterium]|nr:hypothetical protein [Alteromonadaceae bacterium]MBB20309.1 hypothetical protein [Rickettsiales bacterium]
MDVHKGAFIFLLLLVFVVLVNFCCVPPATSLCYALRDDTLMPITFSAALAVAYSLCFFGALHLICPLNTTY